MSLTLNLLPPSEIQYQKYQSYKKAGIFFLLFIIAILWSKKTFYDDWITNQSASSNFSHSTLSTSSVKEINQTVSYAKLSSEHPLNVPLSELKLIGTLYSSATLFALILTPKHQIFRMKIGDSLGFPAGKITSIQRGKLKIQEKMGESYLDRTLLLESV